MNFLQIIGLILFAVGLVKLLYLRKAIRKGYRTSGKVAEKKQSSKNILTNHPSVEFQDQKGKKRVMSLKVSKSFIEIHSKDKRIDIIFYEGRIFHPNEIYSSFIIPALGLIMLLVGLYV